MGDQPVTGLETFHDAHDGRYVEVGGRRVVDHYGRPDRAHLAVRNGVGVIEQPYDVILVSGDDRHTYLDNVVSNAVPAEEGRGCYALLLNPGGRIELDMYIYTAADRLLVLIPPGHAEGLLADWREKVFIQDVTFEHATDAYTILGVHGPRATEKLASVIEHRSIPEERYAFASASLEEAAATVILTDAPLGEVSYEVICARYDAEVVMETLINRGLSAVPFGRQSWNSLSLEAGTPLFEPDLAGQIPNVCGVRSAVDFEKGCFIGQEIVSRIENRGRPPQRLIGLTAASVSDAGDTIRVEGTSVGHVTRSVRSPSLGRGIALGIVSFDLDEGPVDIRGAQQTIEADIVPLPFVDGSAQSGRLPTYRTSESVA